MIEDLSWPKHLPKFFGNLKSVSTLPRTDVENIIILKHTNSHLKSLVRCSLYRIHYLAIFLSDLPFVRLSFCKIFLFCSFPPGEIKPSPNRNSYFNSSFLWNRSSIKPKYEHLNSIHQPFRYYIYISAISMVFTFHL